jgi:chemotaxis protein histidine kinase CheA
VSDTLTLSARHETGAILIRIEDDGRGINRERVLQRAWNRGLVEQGVVPAKTRSTCSFSSLDFLRRNR